MECSAKSKILKYAQASILLFFLFVKQREWAKSDDVISVFIRVFLTFNNLNQIIQAIRIIEKPQYPQTQALRLSKKNASFIIHDTVYKYC